MKATQLRSGLRVAGAAVLAVMLGASLAEAQRAPAERVMIPTLQSADKALGVQAAEAIRDRLTKETNVRELVVVPKADINNSLQSSGYSTTEALAPSDAKALATLVRAAQYVDGTVTRTAAGYKIDARLILTRDMTRGQVLPSVQSARLDDAANQVAKAIKAARRQIPAEEQCHNNSSQGQYQAAIAAARAEVQRNPNANIAAACLAQAYARAKMEDSAIAVAERIRSADPRNITALRLLVELYQAKQPPDPKGLDVLASLAAADPTNIRQIQDVVTEFGKAGQPQRAIPLVRDLLQNNPGDPQLLSLAWIVYLNARDFQGAINVGNELIRVDTAAATADFYSRLAGAYVGLNQPEKAVEAAARGAAKFPNDPNVQLIGATALLRAGQAQRAAGDSLRAAGQIQQGTVQTQEGTAKLQRAAEYARRAVSANPKLENGYLVLIQAQGDLGQTDAVASTLQEAARNGVNKSIIAALALQRGNAFFKAGQASKSRDDFTRAIRFLAMSDSLEASADAKFLIGASAFYVGQSATNDAADRKSCELARTARDSFTLAQANLPAGGQKFPNEAAQLLTAIPQFSPAVNDYVKRFCR
ncbi:MAG: tetratricopeptide repeat protein [Gemmatimonadaceae bacterium]